MRFQFEKDLSEFSGLSKEETHSAADGGIEGFQRVLDFHLEKAAKRQGTSVEDQKEIYRIQQQKQEIMASLKSALSCIDDPECVFENDPQARKAMYDSERDIFSYRLRGQSAEATFGEIVTDMSWGMYYSLDKTSTPRRFLKQYVTERAKKDLRRLLNSQIIISETSGLHSNDTFKTQAYEAVKQTMESGREREQSGFMAETVVKNILRKTQYDSGAEFEIVEADTYQDVEQKIDFIIHRLDRNRGVEVRPNEGKKDVGIQFTLNNSAASHKAQQIERSKRKLLSGKQHVVDDLILVVFPMTTLQTLVKEWRAAGSPAGGPDKFLSRDMAKELFYGVMQGLMTPQQIDAYWDNFKNYFKYGETT